MHGACSPSPRPRGEGRAEGHSAPTVVSGSPHPTSARVRTSISPRSRATACTHRLHCMRPSCAGSTRASIKNRKTSLFSV
ncbi:hypothetical protein A33M_3559 [Rhodovulum sp. PH10]|nr:hypothetical protein A33M_3559 [Rhodovulum sp. PH10]